MDRICTYDEETLQLSNFFCGPIFYEELHAEVYWLLCTRRTTCIRLERLELTQGEVDMPQRALELR